MWRQNIDWLRDLEDVPAALRNALVLVSARRRWEGNVVSRTSMHDLLFTRPGDEHPFDRAVTVQAVGRTYTLQLVESDAVVLERSVIPAEVDAALDELLTQLLDGQPICRHCGRTVVTSRDQFDVFEQMHYVCFHYLFEHDPADPDSECRAGGCPSANLSAPPPG